MNTGHSKPIQLRDTSVQQVTHRHLYCLKEVGFTQSDGTSDVLNEGKYSEVCLKKGYKIGNSGYDPKYIFIRKECFRYPT